MTDLKIAEKILSWIPIFCLHNGISQTSYSAFIFAMKNCKNDVRNKNLLNLFQLSICYIFVIYTEDASSVDRHLDRTVQTIQQQNFCVFRIQFWRHILVNKSSKKR